MRRGRPLDAQVVSARVVEWLSEPLLPVMVTVKLRPRFRPLARTVSVDVEVAGFGENDSVSPEELSVADSVTEPVKPFVGVILTV